MTQPSPDLPPPSEVPIRERHIRAPQGDGEVLIEPALLEAFPPSPHNRILASTASNQLFDEALRYTREYRDVAPNLGPGRSTNNILAGHQPTLFHPGVWLKNFVLSRVQPAINLVVDNDIAGDVSIRVPSGTIAEPTQSGFALDKPYENVPFEERPIVSPSSVREFASRLRSVFNPVKWFAVSRQSSLTAEHLSQYLEIPRQGTPHLPLGETFARARHRLEQDYGLQTLELPLSIVAQSDAFRTFALLLLKSAGRFREIYNRSLDEYRIVNKIRSASHPVPALATESLSIPELSIHGEWMEAPFWIWTKANPRRRRLFIRQDRIGDTLSTIAFTDRQEISTSIMGPRDSQDDPAPWLQLWRGMEDEMGIKIRPRALITTMYARLFLSDLFIHGIGGAKYDELTDAIIRRFFGIEPPAFMTVTGTVRLPIPRPDVSVADVRNVKQLIREIRFHPEKFVNDASPAIRESATQFAAKKAELLRQHQFHFRGASAEQFRALDDLNQQLHVLLTDVEMRLRDELNERERDYQTNRLLGSREYSFVLHPADELPEQLKRMAAST